MITTPSGLTGRADRGRPRRWNHPFRDWARVALALGLLTASVGLVLVSQPLLAAEEGSWSPTDKPVPNKYIHGVVRLDDGKVLAAGGDPDEHPTKMVEVYDPQAPRGLKWSDREPMNYARGGHDMVKLLDGRVMVLGSSAGNADPPPEIYDPQEDAWHEVPDPPAGRYLQVLGGSRCDGQAVPDWCGDVLAVGGSGAAVFDPDTEEWTPTGSPTDTSGLPYGLSSYRSEGMVQLDGAPCEDGDPPAWCGTVLAAGNDRAEIYDPMAGGNELPGVWKPTEGMNLPRNRHTLVALSDGDVLAVGGNDADSEPVTPAELYRPSDELGADDGEWIPPSSNAWTETDALDQGRVGHTATFLPDADGDGSGKVMVAGGRVDTFGCLTSVEVFDPTANDGAGEFVEGPAMTGERAGHTATRLADEQRVLALGGLCDRGSAELYRPGGATGPPEIDEVLPDRGLVDGGETVTIHGVQFTGTTNVTFGGVPAQDVNVDHDGRITAVAPEHEAGTVPVHVTNEHGTSDDVPFTYGPRAGVWTQVDELDHVPEFDGVQAVSLGTAGVLAVYREDDEDHTPRAARYDPGSDSVVATADPPVQPVIAAALEDGRALVAGPGEGFDDPQSAVYDADEDEWVVTSGAPVFSVKPGNAVALGDGRVLAATIGEDGETKSQVYEPDEDAWNATGQPAEGVPHGASSVLVGLEDGRALVAGGGNNDGQRSAAQLFHSGDDAWAQAADLGSKRGHHAGVRLADDRVLVAGGRGVGSSLPGTEIFDPEGDSAGDGEGRWLPQGFMAYTRRHHTVARLVDGSVLAVGGGGEGFHPKADADRLDVAEVFRPQTGTWHPTGSQHEGATRPGAARLRAGCADLCGHVVAMGGWGISSVERYVPRPRIVDVEPEQAPPGHEVTITGFDLAAADEVTLGGESVEFSMEAPASGPDSPGRITATVPQRPDGPAPVTVTTEVVTSEGPPALPSNEEGFEVGPLTDDDDDDSGDDDSGDGDSGDDSDDDSGDSGGDDGGVDPVGQVDDVTAEALSDNEIRLEWSAVADGGGGVADRYVVAQSRTPIDDVGAFEDALALCDGVCSDFAPPPDNVGDDMTLTVTGLSPQTTYHYAVAAVDADGRRGPISTSVAATTGGDAATEAPDDSPGGAGAEGSDAASPGGSVVRVAGADRITTALAASQEVFEDGQAQAAVLARADVFADGLAGVPLAAAENGPLLLTGSSRLDERVATELARVVGDGARVFLLGGEAALSTDVEQQVAQLGFEPVRLGGANRFATAAAIADEGLQAPGRVLFATGGEFADAVTAGAAAARADAAVLLTAGDRLPQATANYLDRHQPDERYAVGGPAADAVDRAEVLVGATRYETAAAVADAFFPEPETVGLATGVRFPDALSGGAHIARYGGPMLLSGPDRLHPAAVQYLSDRAATIGTGVLYGGAAALGQPVADEASAAITTDS